MRNQHTTLRIEALEQRVVPSTSAPALVAPAVPAAVLSVTAACSRHHQQALHGTVAGGYTVVHSIPDAGTQYNLTGAGVVHGLGPVTVTGVLNSTGFIQNGHATGTLTLQNARGTVTLQLEGPTQPGFAPLPNQFQYTVVSATGAYAGLHDSGTIDLHLRPNSSNTAGIFSMNIHSHGQ